MDFNLFSTITVYMVIMMAAGGLALLILQTVQDKKTKAKIGFIIKFIMFLIYFAFIGVCVPLYFVLEMFENMANGLLIFGLIGIVWTAVSLFIEMKNKFIILYNDDKEIYIRDVNVKYSPAVLSYLMNNKIEVSKDLPATLLNLCLKNCLRINENSDESIAIEDLKNKKEVAKLSDDEKYAYEMLTSGVNNAKINNWKNIVKKEYSKYGFSNEHKTNMLSYLIGVYVIMFLAIFIFFPLIVNTIHADAIIIEIMLVAFFAIWEYKVFSEGKDILFTLIIPNEDAYQNEEFMGIYTDKGAIEFNKWEKFEKFIKEYTLIKDRDHKSVVVLGKYLSYSIALGINKNCDTEIYNQIKSKYVFDFSKITSLYEGVQD